MNSVREARRDRAVGNNRRCEWNPSGFASRLWASIFIRWGGKTAPPFSGPLRSGPLSSGMALRHRRTTERRVAGRAQRIYGAVSVRTDAGQYTIAICAISHCWRRAFNRNVCIWPSLPRYVPVLSVDGFFVKAVQLSSRASAFAVSGGFLSKSRLLLLFVVLRHKNSPRVV